MTTVLKCKRWTGCIHIHINHIATSQTEAKMASNFPDSA